MSSRKEGFCRVSLVDERSRSVTRKEEIGGGLQQTECRKSHVNSGRRLICKHNARQLYGSTIERPDAESASFSLPLSLHSVVNFSRTPVLAPLHISLSLSFYLSKRFNDRFLLLPFLASFLPSVSLVPIFVASRSADTEIRASPRLTSWIKERGGIHRGRIVSRKTLSRTKHRVGR